MCCLLNWFASAGRGRNGLRQSCARCKSTVECSALQGNGKYPPCSYKSYLPRYKYDRNRLNTMQQGKIYIYMQKLVPDIKYSIRYLTPIDKSAVTRRDVCTKPKRLSVIAVTNVIMYSCNVPSRNDTFLLLQKLLYTDFVDYISALLTTDSDPCSR